MKEISAEYLSVEQGERKYGLSRWTLRRMAYDGRIASVKIGSRLLLPVSELDRIMAEGMRPRVTQ